MTNVAHLDAKGDWHFVVSVAVVDDWKVSEIVQHYANSFDESKTIPRITDSEVEHMQIWVNSENKEISYFQIEPRS